MEPNASVSRYGLANTVEQSRIRESPVCQLHDRFRANEAKLLIKGCLCKSSIVQFCEIRMGHCVSIQPILSLYSCGSP